MQGRCAAILSNGRRCPNAALTGSRYCGLETHQALNGVEGDEVATLTGDTTATLEDVPEQAAPAVEPAAPEACRRGRAAHDRAGRRRAVIAALHWSNA